MDLKFGLIGGAFITLGLTNNVGPGVTLGGEVRADIFTLGLEGRAVLPSELGNKLTGKDVRDYGRYESALYFCLRKWHLFACGVGAAGFQAAYTPNFQPNMQYDGVWEVGPRVGGELGLGRNFGIRAWGEVLFNPFPTAYTFDLGPSTLPSVKSLPNAAGFIGAAFVVKFRDYDD